MRSRAWLISAVIVLSSPLHTAFCENLTETARKELQVETKPENTLGSQLATVKLPYYKNELDRAPSKFIRLSLAESQLSGFTTYSDQQVAFDQSNKYKSVHLDFSRNLIDFFNIGVFLGLGFGSLDWQFKNPIGQSDKGKIRIANLRLGLEKMFIQYRGWQLLGAMGAGQYYMSQVSESAIDNKNYAETVGILQLAVKSQPIFVNSLRLAADYTQYKDMGGSSIDFENNEARFGLEYAY